MFPIDTSPAKDDKIEKMKESEMESPVFQGFAVTPPDVRRKQATMSLTAVEVKPEETM